MRQAGRYLPEYRALKERYDFLTMVRTPELAAEVTLQPLARFPLDAAILFSDILTIPEAMGQPYRFREQGGIEMEYRLDTPEKIAALQPEAVCERLAYVGAAHRLVRQQVGTDKALLGFCGSPWTLATYMIEGGSTPHAKAAKELFFSNRALFDSLMEKLTGALVEYLKMQAEAGADAVQIFDSWAALAPAAHYEALSLQWIRRVIEQLPPELPVILYAKGAVQHQAALWQTGAQVLSLDWTADMTEAAAQVPPGRALQGNLDPALLTLDDASVVREETLRVLNSVPATTGHIFNLGHGITPDARIENVETLAEAVVP